MISLIIISKVDLFSFPKLAHVREHFSKCHCLYGCPNSRKMNKLRSSRAHWMTARINLSIFAVLIFFPMTYINVCLAAAVSHVSDSKAVFVTRTALLHSLLFITLIPYFNSYFVMYSACKMTTDN